MKKVIDKIRNIFKILVHNNTVILSLYILTIELLFKVLVSTFRIDYSILRIFISAFLISILINLIKKQRINKIVSGLLAFIIAFYSFVQLGFNNFMGSYMSVNTSSQLGKVTDYIGEYIESFKIEYYFIFIPFILYIIYLIFIKNITNTFRKRTIAIYPSLIILYYLTLTIGFMQNKYQYVTNLELIRNPSIATVTVNQFGVGVYGILDIKSKFIKVNVETSIHEEEVEVITDVDNEKEKEENKFLEYLMASETDNNLNTLNKYFYTKERLEDNEYTGIFEGKNVILILMESVGELMYNEEYFPTLYKMYNEGITFTNNYSPRTSCSTGNNEFSTLTSLFAINNVCTSNIYKNNSYFESVFNLFNNAKYKTSAYHDYTDKYYFRNTFIPNMGASTFKDVEALKIKYNEEYKEWPSDVELVKKAYPIFSKTEKNQNYFAYLVTVTTHQPYGVSSEYGDKNLSKFKNINASQSVKRYYSKMMELDKAMETLLKNLEKDGTLDDTVIVMFGDHYPYGLKTSELQKQFSYSLNENHEIERTPFIIYNAATPGVKIDKYTTYMDILPTIANLFNLHDNSRYYMGEDALSPTYNNYAIFSDGSWQSNYAFYNVETSKITYKKDSDYEYSPEEIQKINNTINKKITMSNLAIQKNYFNYLDKKRKEYNELDEETINNVINKNNEEEVEHILTAE